MNLAKLSIKRPTFITAILVSMLVLGVISLSRLSVRMFPDVEFPYVVVITTYQGAGVNEIEQLVSKPIEDAMSGISGLKHITSINQDNVSIVLGEFNLDKNPDLAAQETRDKMGQIRPALPDNIDEPMIMKADVNAMPLMTLSLKSATLSPKQLYDFAYDVVSKDFAQVDGVSQISLVGGQRREIQVQVDRTKLREHELTLSALSARIQANTLNIPAGTVDRGAEQIAFRTMGEFNSVKEIGNVVVSFLGNDIPVKVNDVANVIDGVAKETSRARLDTRDGGQDKYESSLLVMIFRQAKGNDVAVSDGVQKKIKEVNQKYKNFDGKPSLSLVNDGARGVRLNIADVKDTILEGILFAIIVVYMFLGSWRSTVITALALPNSLIGAFLFMYIFGFSLNVISLMSLSLAVGLLIDDAIVVRENIFRHYEEGSNPVKAAIFGTKEVTLAVIATTSAVIAVFLPVAFLSGIMGQFFREFGLTVVFAMVISILDALTVAPMLSAYFIPDHNKKKTTHAAFIESFKTFWQKVIKVFRACTVEWFNKAFMWVEKKYGQLISFIVRTKGMKPLTLLACVLMVFIVVAFSRSVKLNFMPSSDFGEFTIKITARPGTSLDQMDKYTLAVEKVIMAQPEVELVSASIASGGMFTTPTNTSSVYVKLHPKKASSNMISKYAKAFIGLFKSKSDVRSTAQVRDYLRADFAQRFASDNLQFSFVRQSGMSNGQSEFIVNLTGDDIDILYAAAQKLMARYATDIPHLVDIQSNFQPGSPELRIQMDNYKMESWGVSSVMAGTEIRGMVDGLLSGKFRENGLEYDIRVKFQPDQQDIVRDFNYIYINNVNNKLVRLSNVSSVVKAESPTRIFRRDRNRYITIEGNLATGGTIGEVQSKAFKIFNEMKSDPKYSKQFKNINIGVSGNAEEMSTMVVSIAIAALMSILFIFMVLSSLYESIITPFTIMTALPMAIVGAVLALIVFGQPFDMFTMIGMIMLLGIVAKNSILLVDYIQQKLREGMDTDSAIVKAGLTRFRPILMTSFALIAGMLPTALGLSEVGSFRKGMGIVVIGGIVSSTILTLVVVPAIFEYMDMFRKFLRRILGRPEHRMVDLSDEELAKKDL